MKKIFYFVVAATVCMIAACGGKNQQSAEEDKAAQELAANGTVILFIGGLLTYGLLKRVKVYEEFIAGARDGFRVCIDILPYLVAEVKMEAYGQRHLSYNSVFQPRRIIDGKTDSTVLSDPCIEGDIEGEGVYWRTFGGIRHQIVRPQSNRDVLPEAPCIARRHRHLRLTRCCRRHSRRHLTCCCRRQACR